MMRGLEARRIAVFVERDDAEAQRNAAPVIAALEQAGARLHLLSDAGAVDADFHSGASAALVVVGGGDDFSSDPRLVQLAREFLAGNKPLAVYGSAVSLVIDAGGGAARSLSGAESLRKNIEASGATFVDRAFNVDEALITASERATPEEFAQLVARQFTDQLDEREVDEMSEMSFPASDPPAVSPATIGPAPESRK
jgi:hypothetical protein